MRCVNVEGFVRYFFNQSRSGIYFDLWHAEIFVEGELERVGRVAGEVARAEVEPVPVRRVRCSVRKWRVNDS